MNASEFLAWWFRGGIGYLEITGIRPRELPPLQGPHIRTTYFSLPDNLPDAEDYIRFEARNAEGFGIYYGVGLHGLKPAQVDGHNTRPKDDTVSCVPGIWADLDLGGNAAVKTEAAEQLQGINPRPSMVIDSGGGLHAYWLFDEPFFLANDQDAESVRAMVRGMALALDSDRKVCNPSRIMRLPGFVNTKPERGGATCEVLSYSEAAYPVETFARFETAGIRARRDVLLADLPPDLRGRLPKSVLAYLKEGAPQGDRNNRLFVCARHYNDNRFPIEIALRDLLPRALADGLTEDEANQAIESAYRYEPSTPNLPSGILHAYAARAAIE